MYHKIINDEDSGASDYLGLQMTHLDLTLNKYLKSFNFPINKKLNYKNNTKS